MSNNIIILQGLEKILTLKCFDNNDDDFKIYYTSYHEPPYNMPNIFIKSYFTIVLYTLDNDDVYKNNV